MVECTRASCSSNTDPKPDGLPEPTKFGDRVPVDHTIFNEENSSRSANRYAIIIQDAYSKWIQVCATKSKYQLEVVRYFQRFMNPHCKPKHVYTDNSKEFKKAME